MKLQRFSKVTRKFHLTNPSLSTSLALRHRWVLEGLLRHWIIPKTLIKKSIITIKNRDNLRCGRALAVGRAIADNNPKLLKFKQGRLIQKRSGLDLYKKANILPGPCSLREISKFQGSLPGYQARFMLVILAYMRAHGQKKKCFV